MSVCITEAVSTSYPKGVQNQNFNSWYCSSIASEGKWDCSSILSF